MLHMYVSIFLIPDSCRLFDMDGTLVDSSAGVVGAWELFAKSYPGIDVQDILSGKHTNLWHKDLSFDPLSF